MSASIEWVTCGHIFCIFCPSGKEDFVKKLTTEAIKIIKEYQAEMEVAKIKYAFIVCVLYHLRIHTEFALLYKIHIMNIIKTMLLYNTFSQTIIML